MFQTERSSFIFAKKVSIFIWIAEWRQFFLVIGKQK
jgi:hypothetical protein